MKRIGFWLPVLLWMAVIFLFSTRERVAVSQDNTLNFIFFKTLHVIEYGILFVLALRASRHSIQTKGTNHYVIAFVVTILYAITDEVHQTFVPTREGRLRDVIIDAFGASVTWFLITTFLPIAPERLKRLAKRLRVL